MARVVALLVLLAAPLSCLGNGASPFNARETVQRAGIGTHSPRLAPPVRVRIEARTTGHARSSMDRPRITGERSRKEARKKTR